MLRDSVNEGVTPSTLPCLASRRSLSAAARSLESESECVACLPACLCLSVLSHHQRPPQGRLGWTKRLRRRGKGIQRRLGPRAHPSFSRLAPTFVARAFSLRSTMSECHDLAYPGPGEERSSAARGYCPPLLLVFGHDDATANLQARLNSRLASLHHVDGALPKTPSTQSCGLKRSMKTPTAPRADRSWSFRGPSVRKKRE